MSNEKNDDKQCPAKASGISTLAAAYSFIGTSVATEQGPQACCLPGLDASTTKHACLPYRPNRPIHPELREYRIRCNKIFEDRRDEVELFDSPYGPMHSYLDGRASKAEYAVPGSSTVPVGEITHYLIPADDLDLGKFGTRVKLDRQGVMLVIISTERATIRRWHGDSAALPQDAPVGYEAPVKFGKPYVDIFDVSVRLENALKHLGSLCRAEVRPATDPFRTR